MRKKDYEKLSPEERIAYHLKSIDSLLFVGLIGFLLVCLSFYAIALSFFSVSDDEQKTAPVTSETSAFLDIETRSSISTDTTLPGSSSFDGYIDIGGGVYLAELYNFTVRTPSRLYNFTLVSEIQRNPSNGQPYHTGRLGFYLVQYGSSLEFAGYSTLIYSSNSRNISVAGVNQNYTWVKVDGSSSVPLFDSNLTFISVGSSNISIPQGSGIDQINSAFLSSGINGSNSYRPYVLPDGDDVTIGIANNVSVGTSSFLMGIKIVTVFSTTTYSVIAPNVYYLSSAPLTEPIVLPLLSLSPVPVGYSQADIDNIGTQKYQQGYEKGYTDGQLSNTNFWGFLSSVGSVPLSFITSMLNFDLFGINVADVVLALLTTALVIILLRLFVR